MAKGERERMKRENTSLGSFLGRAVFCAMAILLVMGMTSMNSQAGEFQLTYTGTFNSSDSFNGTAFANGAPFTEVAVFTDTGTNYAAPVGVPGFVAYSPLWATISFGGNTYTMDTASQNAIAGVTVAVFDRTTPFGPPNHYAVGLLSDVLSDGTGIIGDFVSASPNYLATSLVPTVYGGYFGVGYGSGPPHGGTIVPWVLHNGGLTSELTLGNYDETYSNGTPLNTAQLQAVPEPGTLALASAGLLALQGFIRQRRKE
jgi:hypothetical protein